MSTVAVKMFFFHYLVVCVITLNLLKGLIEGLSHWCEDALRKTNPKR